MFSTRYIYILIFSLLFIIKTMATTPTGEWTTHMSYVEGQCLAISDNKVYCVANGSLFSYGFNDNSIETYSKVTGLSDVYINSIAYSSTTETLVICYDNGNIDLMDEDGITNIPDLSLKVMYGDKTINKVDEYNGVAYISTGFGILKVNISKAEISETYTLSNGSTNDVYGVAILNDVIYAATDNGIYQADANSSNLQNFANWSNVSSIDDSSLPIMGIISYNNCIVVAQYNENTGYYFIRKMDSGGNWDLLCQFTVFGSFFTNNNILTVGNGKYIKYFDTSFNETNISSYNFVTLDFPLQNSIFVQQVIPIDENIFYVADKYQGLLYYQKDAETVIYTPDGPATNTIWDIDIVESENLIRTVHGTTTYNVNNTWTKGAFSTMDNDEWTFVSTRRGGETYKDYVGIISDPQDVNHFYISSFGYGVLEYQDNTLVTRYTEENSSIQNAVPGTSNYIRTYGMTFDSNNNLWITNSHTSTQIHVKTSDDQWYAMGTSEINCAFTKLLILDDIKFAITPYNGDGILAYNDNDTYDDTSDDNYMYFSITSSEEEISDKVNDIELDNDGTLWVATDNGVALFYSPTEIMESASIPTASRITIPRNDGSGLGDYLLDGKAINSIAVDGGNRKWLATSTSGVYLVSSDGLDVVHHFTEDNSALLSDNVHMVKINGETGEVFFATDAGLITYQADASTGDDSYDDIKVYPNPVREDYYGDITITGLIEETTVKITDVSGNLVNQTTSNGGTATWDATNFYGKRVATGVYLIFCSNSDGSQSAMTKVLVIN